MHDWFQKYEKYCTEVAGPWQTRHCDPREYEATVQELIQLADKLPHTAEETWGRQQAKILQNRADYIRQRWAEKQAKEEARKQADERFNQLLATMQANLQAWQATQITQQSTPPAPQEAKKEEANHEENAEITAEKQEQQPLYQATVEDDTECTTKHGNSMLDSNSTLSMIPRLCTTRSSGDPAACLSNAPLFAYQHTLNLAHQDALILGLMLDTIFGYIQHSQSMEATGEG